MTGQTGEQGARNIDCRDGCRKYSVETKQLASPPYTRPRRKIATDVIEKVCPNATFTAVIYGEDRANFRTPRPRSAANASQ
jgi:hypothetical protein